MNGKEVEINMNECVYFGYKFIVLHSYKERNIQSTTNELTAKSEMILQDAPALLKFCRSALKTSCMNCFQLV